MKILLSDASGLTSRQLATILSRKGHTVHLLTPPGIALTKFTVHVSKVHSVPPFGVDPYAWLEAALSIITSAKSNGQKGFDVLICTQEQVTILSAEISRVKETGIKIAVPEFRSLRRVMDKVSACETLREIGLKQPESVVLSSSQDLSFSKYEHLFPAFAKLPIATGSTGVRYVKDGEDLAAVCDAWKPFQDGGKLLLQNAISGPLLMICGVFFHGRLVAWHSCLRAREGINGGASVKVSMPLPVVGPLMEKLGGGLGWHGGLSLDAILVDKEGGEKELYVIDVNPRIVEPMNGLLAGMDLVATLLSVSLAEDKERSEEWWDGKVGMGREGIVTHQLLLAILAAAKQGRLSIIMEIWGVVSGRGTYKGSVEELTPLERDWWSAIFLLVLTAMLLVGGRRMVQKLSGETISNYAVSPSGWREIVRGQEEKGKGQ